jgi:hypothetical protein
VTEAIFPLVGVLAVFLAVLPAAALMAKAGLVLLERSGLLHRLDLRYPLLVGASLLPLAWLVSAGLHQSEARAVVSCLFDHDSAVLCLEPAFFAVLLSVLVVGRGVGLWRRNLAQRLPTHHSNELNGRMERLLAAHPELSDLHRRVEITDAPHFAIATLGLLRQRVVVGAAFAAGLDDASLTAALGHEAEHVRARDPLRYFLLELALALNPAGAWLLRPHASRWLAAREAHCDREAVTQGAAPLSLADALLFAARPQRGLAALGAADAASLRLRVNLLMAFSERRPELCCHRGPSAFAVGSCLVALALLLPHHLGTAALDLLHSGTEQAITTFLP